MISATATRQIDLKLTRARESPKEASSRHKETNPYKSLISVFVIVLSPRLQFN